MNDIQTFHRIFYETTDKATQDAFILKYCIVSRTFRRRPKNEKHSPKKHQVKCFIRNVLSKEKVPVCQTAFLNVLGISKHRLSYVMKRFTETGQVPIERRGGDRKTAKYREKLERVQMFINQLKCTESHYCRSVTRRMYPPSELSISKFYSMYAAQAPPTEVLKKSYFRFVFNRKYNLSFRTPRTDVCSKCLELSERIKYENNLESKNKLITEKRIHNLRAKEVFELLRENREDLITLSFDCQKNLVLPKVPDQSAYYSRQLYFYNFTIVQGSSKSSLSRENVFFILLDRERVW